MLGKDGAPAAHRSVSSRQPARRMRIILTPGVLIARRAFRRSAGGLFSARAALLTVLFRGPIPASSWRGVVTRAEPRTAGNQACETCLPEPHQPKDFSFPATETIRVHLRSNARSAPLTGASRERPREQAVYSPIFRNICQSPHPVICEEASGRLCRGIGHHGRLGHWAHPTPSRSE